MTSKKYNWLKWILGTPARIILIVLIVEIIISIIKDMGQPPFWFLGLILIFPIAAILLLFDFTIQFILQDAFWAIWIVEFVILFCVYWFWLRFSF